MIYLLTLIFLRITDKQITQSNDEELQKINEKIIYRKLI